jgi:hypothetical protein
MQKKVSRAKRIHIFYSIQRSGSTPLSRILSHYLDQTEKFLYLDEFFAPKYFLMKIEQGRISSEAVKPASPQRLYSLQECTAEVQRRQAELLKNLKTRDYRYSLKMFADNDRMLADRFDALADHAQYTFIVRKNVLEHLLSFLASCATQKFYQRGGLRFEPRAIVAKRIHFNDFIGFQCRIKQRMRSMPDAPTVYYEDFVTSGPQAILGSAGFSKPLVWNEFVNSERQNPSSKLNFFQNQDEIISWYKDSSLNEIFPIR